MASTSDEGRTDELRSARWGDTLRKQEAAETLKRETLSSEQTSTWGWKGEEVWDEARFGTVRGRKAFWVSK
ncbi:hypothetical protein QTP70_010575 [Hemibagrus guttatus]|uniref:Uncharacterized protein n=1 Tax=Hemibagrus guttatus TaxID=175788 RepID=A0AAE0V5Y8_9TELE|nr:hypothetical protein QTP70_010575 [Hemibagrus guttatus]